jgi:16S rRNA (adenine1518-N6/adenine1519-N6)-dimethyltransferase
MTLYEEARAALNQFGFRPRKSLGQNFLIHERVLDAILRLLALGASDKVLEIGPGLGFLTRRLVDLAEWVWAVEVDATLVARLQQGPLGAQGNFELIEGDILNVPLSHVLPAEKIKLVGNLPYSISTPVLFRLFELRQHFSSLVLMLQKEVADRVAAVPGTKDYGTLSVWSHIHGRISEKVAVSPEAFFPKPKVRSTIIKMELHPQPLVDPVELPVLRGLVRAAFGQRRKTLSNVLTAWLLRRRGEIDEILRTQNIEPQRRGETLSIVEFIALARGLRERGLPMPQ